jgi:release factor glutamine methyltransferase
MGAVAALPTCAVLLQRVAARLGDAGIATARLDAEVLLALAMHTDRAGLYARLPSIVPAGVEQQLAALVARRARREPIAYITGVQEFWSLPFEVTPAVLIPRPETELLVEIILEGAAPSAPGAGWWEDSSRGAQGADGAAPCGMICDVGTGSGCIAVALARKLRDVRITALDISADALAVAARNASAHAVSDRITFVESDLFGALDPAVRFDVIVSNPPYCRPGDPFSPELACEPQSALLAGPDGLTVIRRLLAAAPARLRPGGRLVMELGSGQDGAVRAEAAAVGLTDIDVEADLAGIPRVVVARRR